MAAFSAFKGDNFLIRKKTDLKRINLYQPMRPYAGLLCVYLVAI